MGESQHKAGWYDAGNITLMREDILPVSSFIFLVFKAYILPLMGNMPEAYTVSSLLQKSIAAIFYRDRLTIIAALDVVISH